MQTLLAFLLFFFVHFSAFGEVVSLSGDWRCVSAWEDLSGMAHESMGDIQPYPSVGNLQIKDGWVYEFEYPCQYLGRRSMFRFDSTWCVKEDNDLIGLYLQNDTLVMKSSMLISGGITKLYVRDTMDPVIISSLMKGNLSPACLGGDWYVVREEWCCYGTQMTYEYPYMLADTIHLDSTFSSTSYSGRKYVVIVVDGVRQKCTVRYEYDNLVNRQSLWLTPANSKKGRTKILYRRCEAY